MLNHFVVTFRLVFGLNPDASSVMRRRQQRIWSTKYKQDHVTQVAQTRKYVVRASNEAHANCLAMQEMNAKLIENCSKHTESNPRPLATILSRLEVVSVRRSEDLDYLLESKGYQSEYVVESWSNKPIPPTWNELVEKARQEHLRQRRAHEEREQELLKDAHVRNLLFILDNTDPDKDDDVENPNWDDNDDSRR